jgi:hypothetical protein
MVDESGSAQKREELRAIYTDALQKLEVLFNTYTEHATKANEKLVQELLKEKQEEDIVKRISALEDNVTKRIQAVENLITVRSNKTLKGGYDQLVIITTEIKIILGDIRRTLRIRKQALISVQSKNHDEIKLINDMKIALSKGNLGRVRSLIAKLNQELTAEKNVMITIQGMFAGVIAAEDKLKNQKSAFTAIYSKIYTSYSKSSGSTLPGKKF